MAWAWLAQRRTGLMTYDITVGQVAERVRMLDIACTRSERL
jgi:hypothetical protein